MTMPDLWPLFPGPSVETLGWILVHFVWQGALVAGLLAGALHLLRDRPPTLRYGLSCAALGLLLALPVGTGLLLGTWSGPGPATVAPTGPESADLMAVVPAEAVQSADAAPATLQARAASWIRPALPWIVVVWAVGVFLFSLRLAGGAWRVRRLRQTSTRAPDKWIQRLQALSDKMGLARPVSVRLSSRAESPMVAGWWRPVVLLPVGLLSGMPPDQVEALLLHELAHIRRHDVLVGRIQALVETLLFFHPATWWISRQVRQTREACCDDLAVRSGTDRAVYARALAGLAERIVDRSRPVGAVAASDAPLLQRIRRVLGPTRTPEKTARRLSAAVAAVLIGGVLMGLAACASQQSTTAPAAEEADEPTIADTAPPPEEPAPAQAEGKERKIDDEAKAVVVSGRDSSETQVIVRGHRRVEVDSVPGGVFVRTRSKGAPDTIEIRRPHIRMHPEPFEHEDRIHVWPDSIEKTILRTVRPDSLARSVRVHVHPDTIEPPFGAWFKADSIERAFRTDRERLERRAREIRMRADSMERELRQKLRPELMEKRARMRAVRDSLKIELQGRIDVDSVRHVMERRADSLARWHRQHADSLHAHMRELKRRTRRAMPERLREQARHLRERAKRLEERAREMEARPDPEEADTSVNSSEFGNASRVESADDRDTPRAIKLMRNGADLKMLLRNARYGETVQQRARATRTLTDAPFVGREVVQDFLRDQVVDPRASNRVRATAIKAVAEHGGVKAQQVLATARRAVEDSDLRRLAVESLEMVPENTKF